MATRTSRHLLTGIAAVPAMASAIPHASELLDHVAAATGTAAAMNPSTVGFAALAGLALFAIRTELQHRATRRQIERAMTEQAIAARSKKAQLTEAMLLAHRRSQVRSRCLRLR